MEHIFLCVLFSTVVFYLSASPLDVVSKQHKLEFINFKIKFLQEKLREDCLVHVASGLLKGDTGSVVGKRGITNELDLDILMAEASLQYLKKKYLTCTNAVVVAKGITSKQTGGKSPTVPLTVTSSTTISSTQSTTTITTRTPSPTVPIATVNMTITPKNTKATTAPKLVTPQKDCAHYVIASDYKNWGESRKACEKLGGDLAVIKSEFDRQCLIKVLESPTAKIQGNFVQLGGFKINFTWKWVDGDTINVPSQWWYPNEPGANDQVVLIGTKSYGYKMIGYPKHVAFQSVCKISN